MFLGYRLAKCEVGVVEGSVDAEMLEVPLKLLESFEFVLESLERLASRPAMITLPGPSAGCDPDGAMRT
jgi:hypothetical protein